MTFSQNQQNTAYCYQLVLWRIMEGSCLRSGGKWLYTEFCYGTAHYMLKTRSKRIKMFPNNFIPEYRLRKFNRNPQCGHWIKNYQVYEESEKWITVSRKTYENPPRTATDIQLAGKKIKSYCNCIYMFKKLSRYIEDIKRQKCLFLRWKT